MTTRREFLKLGGAAGAFLVLSTKIGGVERIFAAPIPGGTIDVSAIPKYADPLIVPPALPKTGVVDGTVDYYEIAMRQFDQFILPTAMGKQTTVWSYGSANHPGTFNFPAFTIEATADRPTRVKWINELVDGNGNYLPHLLPVDPTLHWCNVPMLPNAMGMQATDIRPDFTGKTYVPLADFTDPATQYTEYTGPVPIVTHVHGAHVGPESDGYPEAWWLPAANNIPAGYATHGTLYDTYDPLNTTPGSAIFQYPNTQRATTIWYHDHALGMTRLNVYAGPAGFWLIRGGAYDLQGGELPGPAPIETTPAIDPPGIYEIPIVVQDRSFDADGQLFYPDTREFFDGIAGPYTPDSDIAPIWNPEFFGNTMVVNGRTWPTLNVEARRYRFRFLNGCDSRFIILKMTDTDPSTFSATTQAPAALPFWQIGAEQGFLAAPAQLDQLLMSPAERADVIVDFTNMEGQTIYLTNEGPDEPFGGGTPGDDFDIADETTTRHVMKFVIGPATNADTSTPPAQLTLPAFAPLPAPDVTRQVSLNEEMNEILDGPAAALCGTVDADGYAVPQQWMEPTTQNPDLGATEVWEIYNFTADGHPIHLHLVEFQVVNRQSLETDHEGVSLQPAELIPGTVRSPEAWETGWKDVVIAYPGEVTRIIAKFDLPGLYVWHCHIVEHEDNEMMLPYRVIKNPSVNLGKALGYSALTLGAGKFTLSARRSGVMGDVGLAAGTKQNFSNGFITGSMFVDPLANNKQFNRVDITGGTVVKDVSQAVADALAASAAAAMLPPTQFFNKIQMATTIVGNGGLNVINVNKIDLKRRRDSLTLQGGPNDEFVINVVSKVQLDRRSEIKLSGGILPSKVLFNFVGPSSKLNMRGNSKAVGTYLIPNSDATLEGGRTLLTGAVYARKGIKLIRGAKIELA